MIMKITEIKIKNFLGARNINVRLTKPVTLFAGSNGAGKSSMQEAIRMAMTGESVRVGLKKDYSAIVTEGQESGFAQVETAAATYSVVLPSGKGHHSENPMLPFVLDAQRFARMDDKERRSFLFGLMDIKMDGESVTKRMIGKGLDANKVKQIAPFLRAGFDAAQKEAQAKAREAKASWKTITGGETYGSNKAASWAAAKPEADASKLEQARSDLAAIETEIEAATSLHGELTGRARQVAERAGKLAELREKAGRFARIQDKLIKDEADLKMWEGKVAALQGSAKSQDAAPCPDCGVMLVMKGGALVHAEQLAKATDEELARLPEYEKALKLMQNAVANGKRDLAAADAAAVALRELEDSGMTEAPGEEEIDALAKRIAALKQSRTNQQAGIRMLEDAVRQAAQADEKTRRAAAIHNDVQHWEAIADVLAPDGIPGEMLAEALGPINYRMATSSDTSGWSLVKIDAGMSITAGGRPYALLSESEKWRADAMIAEAVSYISEIGLLVLDRLDVLDLNGREDLLYWLSLLAKDGEIDTALVFGTLKALPAKLPDLIGAHWIEGGYASLQEHDALEDKE
jgi:hypothetical protein